MIEFRQLRYFHALARYGSFARAAEALYVSQPALTRTIQTLEREIGSRLVIRQRGRSEIALTAAGHEVLEKADSILAQAASLRTSDGDRAEQSALGFGVGPQFASVFLPDVLPALERRFPGLTTTVVVGPTASMLDQLLAGELEFFISGQVAGRRPSRVRCADFVAMPMRYSVREGHPLLAAEEVTVEMIGRYPRYTGSVLRERILAEDDETIAQLAPTICVDNFDVLVQLTENSDGVLGAFASSVRPPLRELRFDLEALLGVSRTFLFTLEDMRLSEPAWTAIDEIRRLIPDRVAGKEPE